MRKQFFKLYANCIPVEGKDCFLIIDFYHKKYLKISHTTAFTLINGIGNFEIENTIKFVQENENNILWQVIDLLIKNGMGFLTDDPKEFPQINTHLLDTPEIINNAIIEIERIDLELHRKLFHDLNEMMCRYVEIWFFSSCNYDDIVEIVRTWDGGFLRGVRLLIDMAGRDEKGIKEFSNLINCSDKIDEIVFYNCDDSRATDTPNVIYLQKDISYLNYKANEYNKIIMEMSFYIEANNRNPFYYKKVCIDKRGNIKNFLANEKVFGQLRTDSLLEICRSIEFQQLWFITNDKIVDIKDSPMRYCYSITDDLIPIEDGYYKMKTKLNLFPWDKVQ